MGRSRPEGPRGWGAIEPAFLLSQVGAHAAARFAERIGPMGLKPPHAGILRAIDEADGLSQQSLCDRLGMFSSRLVGLLDDLEGKGLVERRANPADRRSHAVHLTEAGRAALGDLLDASMVHRDAILGALDEAERATLAGLLARVAADQGLAVGVHPGLKKPGEPGA